MSYVTPEQRALGRENANRALGVTRREWLATAAAAPALGAYYFGYKKMEDKPPVRAAIIGTGNEGCDAMIRQHNRDYLNYIGFCDARPSNQQRARKQFSQHNQYGAAEAQKLKQYDDYQKMLEDKDVEVVVIALPLWLHAPVAIEAMKAGKHVFTEKLMAHSVSECKEMCRVARETNRLLADRPPAPLFGAVRQREFPRPAKPPRRHPPHPGPLAPQQRAAACRSSRTASRFTTLKPATRST